MSSLSAPSTEAGMLVLHVDDSAADRYRRRRALERAQFRVVDAGSGTAAKSALTTERIDVALVDVGLPDTTGFELAQYIKCQAAASHRDLAVILISSVFTESEYRVEGLESGADAYLIEPITDAELVATLHAVTRRLQQVRDARVNERLLDALFEYVPDGITVADAPDALVRRVSRFGQALTGHAVEGIVLTSEGSIDWEILEPDGRTPALPQDLPVTRAVTSGAVTTDRELILVRRDGRRVFLSCNAGPIRDEEGRVTGGISVWRDITARKEIEEALRRRTADLRQADQTKNEFLATVVHELRQPIQAAMAGLALMKLRTDRDKGEHAREVVERQLDQIARITEDLLDTTRIVRGDVELRLEPQDLGLVLRRSLETVHPTFVKGELTLRSAIPPSPVPVVADAARLQQVFVNLLSNAARYTPSEGEVDVALEASARRAIVRVKDTGDGIPPERISRIFELFSRASSRAGGFGIGLAVARSLVEAHGGTIEAHSEGPGKGSEFTVTLPLGHPS